MAKSVSNIDTSEVTEQTGREEQGGFLLDNLRLFGIIGVALLIVASGIFYFFVIRSAEANEQAQIALARVRPYYDQGAFPAAISGDSLTVSSGEKAFGLQAIVDQWGSTSAGKVAALFLGNSYLALMEPEKAKEPYEIATGADADLIRSAAHAGLAAVAESSGNYEEAAEEYAKAASEDRLDLNTPKYLVNAARNYERADRKEEAIEHYRRVANLFPSSQANTEARLALARLDADA
jgi:tetratricopeptide (TPR) repeat protein